MSLVFEHTEVQGFEPALRGMRNPYASHNKSDSTFSDYGACIGPKDKELARKLLRAGEEHAKFARMIVCYVDITGPMYWWKQFDTYRFGVEKNSFSTMHRLTAKPFVLSDFSFEDLIGDKKEDQYFDVAGDFEEKWLMVKDHPNYMVSNKGRVFSRKTDQYLTPSVNSSNYKKVVLDKKQLYVHRLVADAFIGNPNDLPEVNHKDGNKWNNNYTNLEFVTKSENALHAFDLGLRDVSGYTRYRVAKTSRRFSDDEVQDIRRQLENGVSGAEIARRYKCTDSIIYNIKIGKAYKQPELSPLDIAKMYVCNLNELRDAYLETQDAAIWRNIVAMLPESYNQKRTCMMSYQAIRHICSQRKGHKLSEWAEFIAWAENLPESWMLFDKKEDK